MPTHASNAQAIGAKKRDELMAAADKRRKTLEDQLNRKLEEAEKTIATTKTAAMGNVRGIATDAASGDRRAADRPGAVRKGDRRRGRGRAQALEHDAEKCEAVFG